MAQIRLSASDPSLARTLEPWAEAQREQGHEVEVLQELRESRDAGLTLAVASLVLQVAEMSGAVDWAKREIREWFTEQPPRRGGGRRHLKVIVVDRDTGETESFDLEE